MPFLQQIFDPHTLTMQHYLNVGNNDGSFNENVPDSESAPDYSADPARDIGDTLALLPTEHTAILDEAIGAFTPDEDFEMLFLSAPSPIPALTEAGCEVLVAKAALLAKGLEALHYKLQAIDPAFAGPHDIGKVGQVFCAEKIKFFASAFFRLTHVHFPLVHYPTFGVPESSAFLILAVTIFGATRCAPVNHTIQAKKFTKLADEYIFLELERLNACKPQLLAFSQLQTLQAAVAMTSNFMMNHNDWSLRERARLRRLPTLICSIRHFQLTEISNKPTLDWHQFIFDETAVR